MNLLIIAVTLLLVIIPEGLPVAVSIASSFSTDNLKDDNILIKKLQAVENAGEMTDIVTSKTSTLTTGDMIVSKFYTGQEMYVRSKDSAPALHNDVTKTLINAIVLNSEAYMEIDDLTCQYVPTGCAVEVSLLNFLEFLGTPDIKNLLVMKARNTE
jgi:P-type E1-E2 ATPase